MSGRLGRLDRLELALLFGAVTLLGLAVVVTVYALEAPRRPPSSPAPAPPGYSTYLGPGYSFAYPSGLPGPVETPAPRGGTVVFGATPGDEDAGAGVVATSISGFDRGLDGFVTSGQLALAGTDEFHAVSERDVDLPGAVEARLVTSRFTVRRGRPDQAEVEIDSVYAIGADGLAAMVRTVEEVGRPATLDEPAVLASFRLG